MLMTAQAPQQAAAEDNSQHQQHEEDENNAPPVVGDMTNELYRVPDFEIGWPVPKPQQQQQQQTVKKAKQDQQQQQHLSINSTNDIIKNRKNSQFKLYGGWHSGLEGNLDDLKALKYSQQHSHTQWKQTVKPSKIIISQSTYYLEDLKYSTEAENSDFVASHEFLSILHRLEDSIRQCDSNCHRRISDLVNIHSSIAHSNKCALSKQLLDLLKKKRQILSKLKKTREKFAHLLSSMSRRSIFSEFL